MKITKLKNMKGGWFIGDFDPSLLKTNDVEVGVKRYKKGDYDGLHYHKIATEITVIVSGRAKMNGKIVRSGDIITIPPFYATDFRVLENDTVTSVVKIPGALNDKYLGKKDD